MNEKLIFTANSKFTVPAGVNQLLISGCAGGAGGSSAATGSGGGGGESILRHPLAVIPGEVLTIIVGCGGAGASYYNREGLTSYVYDPNTMDAQNGGDTFIKRGATELLRLHGGKGSKALNINDEFARGQKGGPGATDGDVINVVGDPIQFAGGRGGSSLFGIGGAGGIVTAREKIDIDGFDAGDGAGFGAGGGGASWGGKTVMYISKTGNGTGGILIVEWVSL